MMKLMLDALKTHKILCAGLDTHNREPLPANSPYFELDNVILTDHTAYSTVEAVEELKIKSAQNIINALTGVPPVYPVNEL
ncbi:MAG: NAD(P)-dependent oxidoreductase [Oscillospiraceae bacterium]